MHLIVIEETRTGLSGYSPDLHGCIAAGTTREEEEQNRKEAIKLHLEGLKEEHLPIPKPHSFSTYLEIPA